MSPKTSMTVYKLVFPIPLLIQIQIQILLPVPVPVAFAVAVAQTQALGLELLLLLVEEERLEEHLLLGRWDVRVWRRVVVRVACASLMSCLLGRRLCVSLLVCLFRRAARVQRLVGQLGRDELGIWIWIRIRIRLLVLWLLLLVEGLWIPGTTPLLWRVRGRGHLQDEWRWD